MMTERKYAMLVQAFKEQPGNASYAARAAGVERHTAKKGWEVGWAGKGWRAINEIVAEEREDRERLSRIRAEAVKVETEAFAAALRGEVRSSALEEFERTNQYLRAAAMTATSMLVSAHRLQPVVQELGAMAPQLVQAVHQGIQGAELTATEAMSFLKQIADFTKAVGNVAMVATEQGARVVMISKGRAEEMARSKEIRVQEPFDSAEARRLAAELEEAALEVEAGAEDGPALSLLEGGSDGQGGGGGPNG